MTDKAIEAEILEIIADPGDTGERLNEIANQFRRGRSIADVMALLDSSNADVVATGAWLLGEIAFDLYNSAPILSQLRNLLNHENADVRFHAFGALYPSLSWQDPTTRILVERLKNDPNEGVRRSAEAAFARMFSGMKSRR